MIPMLLAICYLLFDAAVDKPFDASQPRAYNERDMNSLRKQNMIMVTTAKYLGQILLIGKSGVMS